MPVSYTAAVVTGKVLHSAAKPEETSMADVVIDIASAKLAASPVAPKSATAASSAKDNTIKSKVSQKVDEHFKQKGETVINTEKDKVDPKNTVDVDSVDDRYLGFGHCEDVFDTIMKGEIPSAHDVYLALLDIADALDFGLFGDKIQAVRIRDNIKHHKITTTEDTKIEVSEAKGEKKKLDTPGKKVTEQTDTIDKKRETTITVTDTLDDQKEEIAAFKETEATRETRTVRTERDERSWKEVILGKDEAETITSSSSTDGSTTVDMLEKDKDGKVKTTRLDERTIHEKGPTVSTNHKGWHSGLVSYAPLGSVADIIGKMNAGYKLTLMDGVAVGMDVLGTVCTLGAGSLLAKGGAKAGGKALVAGGTKAAAKSAAKGGMKAVAKTAAKSGTKAAAKSATRAAAAKISGPRALARARMKKLISTSNLKHGANLVAHNPNKMNIWKSLADCAQVEKRGGSAKAFIKSCTPSGNKLMEMNARGMETMYRYARRYNLLTPENLERMRKGLAPLFPDGLPAHLDHLVQVKYAPELKTLPANLRILKPIENLSRNAGIDKHCINTAKNLMNACMWRPGNDLIDILFPKQPIYR